MASVVEDAQADFTSRLLWVQGWQSVFFTLYCIVMGVSLAIYLCLLRAVATIGGRKETPLYLFLLLHFLTTLVEDGVIVHQFILIHHHTTHTEFLCRMYTYITYGNKAMQPMVATVMLYYTWLRVELKRQSIEARTRQFFPLIVVGLLVAQFFLVIWPTLNVSGTISGQFCYNIDDSYETERLHGWFYLVMIPYFLPLAAGVFPAARLALKIHSRDRSLLDSEMAAVRITLAVVVGYYFFHLLYYTLMLGREVESLVLDRSHWRKLLGLHVWYITRPMFALIGYGWNIVVPLAPFSFDPDLQPIFPGNWINRHRLAAKDVESKNSICMSDASSMARVRGAMAMVSEEEEEEGGKQSAVFDDNKNTAFANPLANMGSDPEAGEYNQSSIVM